MSAIGIFYGSSSGMTENVAIKIWQKIGKETARLHNVAEAKSTDLAYYDFLIFGIPTWGIGQLQDDWAEFMINLENVDLKDKRIALFGLGDQETYPDTFSDALGIVYDFIKKKGCNIIGQWPAEGYTFDGSRAVRNGNFVGLVIDEKNQPELTKERIDKWIKIIGLL